MAPPIRKALFVIDIQNELIADPETCIADPERQRVIHASEEILKATRSIIDTNVDSDCLSPWIIVFVQHEEAPPNGTMLRGTKPWELLFPPRANREDEILVSKSTGDTFESNPDLAQSLRDKDISEIVAFGIQSDCCVKATSLGALNAGFGVTVLSGAHSTYNSDGKTAVEIEREVERHLSTQGARIVPWEEEISTWA